MSNFSKIVIIILLVMSFFFIREKYGNNISNFLSSIEGLPKIEIPFLKNDKKKEEVVKKPTVAPSGKENTAEKKQVYIYFLALDSSDNVVYKKVQRELPLNENKLEYSIKELIKGPGIVEKSMGAYSEVPQNTKLLKIKQNGDKIVIDLSSDFQYGGGTDSIYSRMMQLIKTSITNTENKKIYLYLDGKQVNVIGGEGIMITQPLTEQSLEI